MTAHTVKMGGSKPSFASIAAMAHSSQSGQDLPAREINLVEAVDLTSTKANQSILADNSSASQLHHELQNSMSRLVIRGSPPPTKHDGGATAKPGLKLDDEQTHVSSSSTKPTSLDGKSVASGNTFALDEKESLRPDDSASVKAAEEEDFNSGSASGAPSSRVGSEAGGRAFRDQFNEISERMGSSRHQTFPAVNRGVSGVEEETPQLTIPPLASNLPTTATHARPEAVNIPTAPFGFEYKEPDEKLFEALDSPKDRVFLLQLEQKVISFVRDSTEPMIDLPPFNSFCRLLAHKLADYYALTHFVDNAVNSVRLYRTPYCRVPTPLSVIRRVPAPADPSTFQPAMKIMRRANVSKDNPVVDSGPNTTESSIAVSKAGSEAGDGNQRETGVQSPTDSVTAKDKVAMTREEKEAKYKEARERIFKGTEDVENPEVATTQESLNEVSRSSSATGKRKAKKSRNNDDGFEARSKFNAYYSTVPYSVTGYDQGGNPISSYNPYSSHHNIALGQTGTMNSMTIQQAYAYGYQAVPAMPALPVPQMSMVNGSHFNGQVQSPPPTFPAYSQPMHSQYFQQIPHPVSVGHSPAMPSPVLSNNTQLSRPQSQMSDQQWPQNPYPFLVHRQRDQQSYYPATATDQYGGPAVHSIPYQYGQLPHQPNMQSGRAQHPVPGSYTRQNFNPQTRAFVPGSGAAPQTTSFGPRSNEGSLRGFNAPVFNGSEISSYNHAVPNSHMPCPPIPTSANQNLEHKAYGPRKSSTQANGPHSPVQNSLSKWGTPAHLPPKPPPPEAPSQSEAQHSLLASIHPPVHVPPLNIGQPMPTFPNGVHSLPSIVNQ